jgi:hypothetical protein
VLQRYDAMDRNSHGGATVFDREALANNVTRWRMLASSCACDVEVAVGSARKSKPLLISLMQSLLHWRSRIISIRYMSLRYWIPQSTLKFVKKPIARSTCIVAHIAFGVYLIYLLYKGIFIRKGRRT